MVSHQEQEPLTPEQSTVVQALVQAGLREPGVKATVAALLAEDASVLATAGAEYLAEALTAIGQEPSVKSPEAVLVYRLGDPVLRRDLLRGARDWVRRHPRADLESAKAEWQRLRATRPPEGRASRQGHIDEEHRALDALVALVRASCPEEAMAWEDALHARLRAKERVDSAMWRRRCIHEWRGWALGRLGLTGEGTPC